MPAKAAAAAKLKAAAASAPPKPKAAPKADAAAAAANPKTAVSAAPPAAAAAPAADAAVAAAAVAANPLPLAAAAASASTASAASASARGGGGVDSARAFPSLELLKFASDADFDDPELREILKAEAERPRPLTLSIIQQRAASRDGLATSALASAASGAAGADAGADAKRTGGHTTSVTDALYGLSILYLDGLRLSTLGDGVLQPFTRLTNLYVQRNCLRSLDGLPGPTRAQRQARDARRAARRAARRTAKRAAKRAAAGSAAGADAKGDDDAAEAADDDDSDDDSDASGSGSGSGSGSDSGSSMLRFLAAFDNAIERIEHVKHHDGLLFLDLSRNRLQAIDVEELPTSLRILNIADNPCTAPNGVSTDTLKALLTHLPLLRTLDGEPISDETRAKLGIEISDDDADAVAGADGEGDESDGDGEGDEDDDDGDAGAGARAASGGAAAAAASSSSSAAADAARAAVAAAAAGDDVDAQTVGDTLHRVRDLIIQRAKLRQKLFDTEHAADVAAAKAKAKPTAAAKPPATKS